MYQNIKHNNLSGDLEMCCSVDEQIDACYNALPEYRTTLGKRLVNGYLRLEPHWLSLSRLLFKSSLSVHKVRTAFTEHVYMQIKVKVVLGDFFPFLRTSRHQFHVC